MEGARKTDAATPFGWPKSVQLPTPQEAEEAARLIQTTTDRLIEDLRDKIEGTSPEMFNTQITV
jgi:hypothetical protein